MKEDLLARESKRSQLGHDASASANVNNVRTASSLTVGVIKLLHSIAG
jgi:hypothetical protein